MKKSRVSRPNVVSLQPHVANGNRQVQRFLYLEKHPRQKHTDFSEPAYVPFYVPLMY